MHARSDNTTELDGVNPQDPFIIFTTVLLALTILLILVLNFASLLVLRRATGIQDTTRMFMASLTSSDLCIGIFSATPRLIYILASNSDSREVWCFLRDYTHPTFSTISALSLLLLTMDRFVVVVRPLRYPSLVTRIKAEVSIALIWILTIAVYCVLFGKYSTESGCTDTSCETCRVVFFFILAATLVFIWTAYVYILRVARQHARRIAAGNPVGGFNGEQNAPQRASTKSMTTVFILTATVFLCWFPTIVFLLVESNSQGTIPKELVFSYAMFLSNSWLNVVIYYGRIRELRQTFKSMLPSWSH